MFKLLRYFSLTSLFAFISIIAALAFFNSRLAVDNLIALEESKNVALTQSFANSLWPQFAPFVAKSSGMTGDELRAHPEVLAFHEAVLAQMEGLSVLKLKVYNLEGLTVYSSDFSQIGESKRDNPGFQTSLAGGTASALIYRDTFNAFEGTMAKRDIVESYIPLRRGPTRPVEAVTELYDDVTPLLQRVNATQRRLTLGITALLLLLYGALFYIVRRADKILQQQYRDLERVNVKLAKQSRELERSNAELEQFAYTASHDLQEPLRKIQAFGDHLMESQGDALGDDALYLERMQDAAGRMRQLIQDLLNYSRVGSKGGAFVSLDLTRLAGEVAADLDVRLAETGGRLELSPLPTVEADPTQMRQLLQNLLGNALKFSRPDTPPVVRVWGDVSEDGVTLKVGDNGIGFDQKYAERVFTMFQRLHGRSAYEGTGMGLAIVRKIVERHEGTVAVESEEGVGTTFTVTLPAPSHLANPVAPKQTQVKTHTTLQEAA